MTMMKIEVYPDTSVPLGGHAIIRLKGVFRCENGWIAVNRAGGMTTVKPSAYRRDSRVEAFAEVPDWDGF